MIYSQPFDIIIKTKCSFSTVCVGMAFSLSCTSDDLKWDNGVSQAAQSNYTKAQQKGNYSVILWLLFPSPFLSSSLCKCVYLGVFLASRVLRTHWQLCVKGRSFILLHFLFWRGCQGSVLSHGHHIREFSQMGGFGEYWSTSHLKGLQQITSSLISNLATIHFLNCMIMVWSIKCQKIREKCPLQFCLVWLFFFQPTVQHPQIFSLVS